MGLVASGQQVVVLGGVGIANNSAAVGGIDGTKRVDDLNFRWVLHVDAEIIFVSLAHKLCQRFLALCMEVTANRYGNDEE